jgi:ParB family chromosome partitioning protein
MATIKSAKNKPALGRGMSALLGASASPIMGQGQNSEERMISNNTGSLSVPIGKVKANKDQPRKIFKDKEIAELSASIKENGLIQPIIVTLEEDNTYKLISGERRLRASRMAGLEHIAVVVKKVTKKEHMAMAIIENVQRADLNCVEEALAYYSLMNEFGLTQEEVAKQIGKDRSTIANFLRILKLPREVIQLLQKDDISFGHAKVLVALKDDEAIKRFARMVVDENLSVRDLEKTIKLKKVKTPKVSNKFFDEKLDSIKSKLETKTGYHFDLKTKSNGSGMISLKYNNEAEFNDIFKYLMSSK